MSIAAMDLSDAKNVGARNVFQDYRIFTTSTPRSHFVHASSVVKAGNDKLSASVRHARSPSDIPTSRVGFQKEAAIRAWCSSKGKTSIRSRSS
jgi:hypothetical protein